MPGKVTIGMACFNHERFVLDALNSVNVQNYPNIEIIIIDDCSNDKSVEVIADWVKNKCKYPCIFIRNEVNQGLHYVLNKIIDLASGEYLSFLATDDIIFPDKINYQVQVMENLDQSFAACYGDTSRINEYGHVISTSEFDKWFGPDFIPPSGRILKDVVSNFLFFIQSALFRNSCLNAINFKFDKKYISEDWHLQIKLATEYNLFGCKKVFCQYREVSTSITRTNFVPSNIHNIIYNHFTLLYDFSKDLYEEDLYFEKLKSLCKQAIHHKKFLLSKIFKMYFLIVKIYPHKIFELDLIKLLLKASFDKLNLFSR